MHLYQPTGNERGSLSGWVRLDLLVGEVLATAMGVTTTLDDFTPIYKASAVGATHLHYGPAYLAAANDILRS